MTYIMLMGFFLFQLGTGGMNAYGQELNNPKEQEMLEAPIDTASLAMKMDSIQLGTGSFLPPYLLGFASFSLTASMTHLLIARL